MLHPIATPNRPAHTGKLPGTRTGLILFICWGWLLTAPAAASLRPSPGGLAGYVLHSWTMTSGLPQNTVNCLLQTGDGYIWLGLNRGLARFDGVRFCLFTRENTPGLPDSPVMALHEDSQRTLWAGTGGSGLLCLRNGNWTRFTHRDGLSNDHIRAIVCDWQGRLWAGTDYGLNCLTPGGRIQIFTTADGLYDNIITALAVDPGGNLWAGTLRGGLALIRERVVQVYGYREGLRNPAVLSLLAARDGNIYAGTMEGLYCRRAGEGFIRVIPGTRHTPVTALREDAEGRCWIGTMAGGMKRLTGGLLEEFGPEQGFPDAYIRDLVALDGGEILAGTDAAGLVRLREPAIRMIGRTQGLPDDVLYAVAADGPDACWIATRNSGLWRLDGLSGLERAICVTGVPARRIRAILPGRDRSLWLGTGGEGLFRLKDGKITDCSGPARLLSGTVLALCQDRQGDLLAGTASGLHRIRLEGDRISISPALLNGKKVQVLMERADGTILAGTGEGLHMAAAGSKDRFLPLTALAGTEITALFEDSARVLWIGTGNKGLVRYQTGAAVFYTAADGLVDNHIQSITEDARRNLWLGTNRGVCRLSRSRLDRLTGDSPARLAPLWLDEAEGMASAPCITGGQPAVLNTGAGWIGFPTARGLALINPAALPADSRPPQIVIEEIWHNGRPCQPSERVLLESPVRQLEVCFTAFTGFAPEKTRFEYRLKGLDANWISLAPGEPRRAIYRDLEPGNYAFQVRAANNSGIWNDTGATLELEIAASFYHSPFFLTAAGFALLALAGVVYWIRRNRSGRVPPAEEKGETEKYRTSTLAPERAEELALRLTRLMESEQPYLNPGLKLGDLARQLKTHPTHLSRIINEHFRLNFNDYINQYRIEAAKQKLAGPDPEGATILDIIYSCGFFSKSVFNTAFKKQTGMTPTEYRKQHSTPSSRP